MKNEKVGMTGLNWILSIFGIIFFASLIIIPPVLRTVIKEEPKKQTEKEELKQLTCTKNNYVQDGANKNSTTKINYYTDKIITYSIKEEYVFQSLDQYDIQKANYARVTLIYDSVDGINLNLNADDSNLKITVEEKCDLRKFKSTVVILPNETEENKINSFYNQTDSITEIMNDLQNEGYTCKQETLSE